MMDSADNSAGRSRSWLVTCEHGGNEVPAEFAGLFSSPGAKQCLRSHRGHDPGALEAAHRFASALKAPLIESTTTRLLVDLNRSESASDVISEFGKRLNSHERVSLLERFHRPYRDRVMEEIRSRTQHETVIHLSIHTFTPRIRGQLRDVDIGILFDPDRRLEAGLVEEWLAALRGLDRRWRVRANEPYLGTADGLTTTCRRLFADDVYAGIEVEINHRYHQRSHAGWSKVIRRLIETLPGNH